MRPGGAGLLLAILLAAGCKGTDPKPAPARDPAGTPTSRPKGKNTDWLDAMNKLPGAGTGVPRAGSWADPRDPGFDATKEGRGLLAGRVLDPNGQGAKNVFIRIDPVGEGATGGAPLGILTDSAGYFAAKDLVPGKAYTLTAEAKTAEGRALSGVVQTRPPQPNVAIALRDDLPPVPGPARPGPTAPGSGLPPAADPRPGGGPPVPDLPPAAPGSDTPLPPPAGLSGDNIPPMDLAPKPPAPKPPAPPPADGAFAPGVGARAGGIPATVGGPPAAAPLPAATPPEATPTARPENTAAGPAPPWKPPAANIPGPPVPALPTLPPSTPPGDGKKSQRPVKRGANFALVDALDRPWNLATSRQGSVVLVEFLTTTCGPCKAAVPGLVDVQSRYAADGLELVGVVCDEAPVRDRLDRAEKYRQAHQLNYALYAEPGPLPGAVRDRLGVTAYPTAVLLDPEGNVAWKGHPGDRSAMEAAVRRALGK